MFHMNEEDVDNIVKEKDETIIELKNIIRKMEEDMEKLKNGLIVEDKDVFDQKNDSVATIEEMGLENGHENVLVNGNGAED